MNVYLIRHGQIQATMATCYGQTDYLPLDTLDVEVKRLREEISFSEGIYVSSPLIRCKRLVLECVPNTVDILYDPRLKEVNCGRWEGVLWDDIPKDEFRKWEENIVHEPFPEGESYWDMFKRSTACLDELIERYKTSDTNVYLFTHGGVIRALTSYLLKLELEHSFRLSMDYARFAKFVIQDKWISMKGFGL